MRTKEIETELILQEMESIKCKVEELNVHIRSFTKVLLCREHDVQSWMEAAGIGKEGRR